MLALRLAALSAVLPLAFGLSGVPQSTSTVRVSRFIIANLSGTNELHTLVAPILPGRDTFASPLYSFLVEHGTRKLLFDIGIRKDTENLAPPLAAQFAAGVFGGKLDTDIFDLLHRAGIPTASIESVIWSHSHFDHTGDMSKFPSSTSLVIDFAGREVTKIDFAASKLTFNDLKAVDYFGDGSFYLVDTPGHIRGHLTALARVTPSPNPTFILLAGDTFHHAGVARPRPAFQKSFPCPAHLLASANAHISTDFFFSSDTTDSFTFNPALATVSLEKVARWDADADVLVLIAHDISIVSNQTGSGGLGGLPYHPQTLNGWKKAGWKEQTVWNFVNFDGPGWLFSPA
ncbi:Metallo-beta-lactamase superfamily protein [Mycena kentingensis (nom. inval.)]|nr:Metallo-beta-lactamase superfamily protein [Mycena kentingensis (nom. inval.)]